MAYESDVDIVANSRNKKRKTSSEQTQQKKEYEEYNSMAERRAIRSAAQLQREQWQQHADAVNAHEARKLQRLIDERDNFIEELADREMKIQRRNWTSPHGEWYAHVKRITAEKQRQLDIARTFAGKENLVRSLEDDIAANTRAMGRAHIGPEHELEWQQRQQELKDLEDEDRRHHERNVKLITAQQREIERVKKWAERYARTGNMVNNELQQLDAQIAVSEMIGDESLALF